MFSCAKKKWLGVGRGRRGSRDSRFTEGKCSQQEDSAGRPFLSADLRRTA